MKKTKQNNNFQKAEGRARSARPSGLFCATRRTLHATGSAGFTLIEMVVSVALFSFVMLAATSVLLSVVDADHKAQGLKSSINNLSLTVESMVRNLRTGSGYVAGSAGCNDQNGGGNSAISFVDHNNQTTAYSLSGGAIQISKDGGLSFSPMTAPEINVTRLCFYVSGTGAKDNIQPRIFMTVGGEVSNLTVSGAKEKTKSRFDLQTMVSQRLPDVSLVN